MGDLLCGAEGVGRARNVKISQTQACGQTDRQVEGGPQENR
jgi:hypothetical protein